MAIKSMSTFNSNIISIVKMFDFEMSNLEHRGLNPPHNSIDFSEIYSCAGFVEDCSLYLCM